MTSQKRQTSKTLRFLVKEKSPSMNQAKVGCWQSCDNRSGQCEIRTPERTIIQLWYRNEVTTSEVFRQSVNPVRLKITYQLKTVFWTPWLKMVQLSWVSIFLIPLLVLMLWMDVALFVRVQHLPTAHYNENTNPEQSQEQTSHVHSAFERLTMKLLVRK